MMPQMEESKRKNMHVKPVTKDKKLAMHMNILVNTKKQGWWQQADRGMMILSRLGCFPYLQLSHWHFDLLHLPDSLSDHLLDLLLWHT